MKSFLFTLGTLFMLTAVSFAQVPTPRSTSSGSGGPLSWTKTGSVDYTLRDKNGNTVSNTMNLKYLSTDTLSVLDKTNRTVYLLADFKNASTGSTGSASILANYVDSNFFITNPNSFAHYVNDEYLTDTFVNINGSYIYYVGETNTTYQLKDIRKYPNWGADSSYPLPYSATNTYWYRDADKGQYGVIKKGKTINYDEASTESDGDDLIVKVNGVKTYRLPGYYNMASWVFKPVTPYSSSGSSSSSSTTATTGCVKGDCNNGWGKYEYDNGHYDGFWKNGKKHGYGLYKWPESGKYIGSWVNDNMEGYGVYIADNKDNIIGMYRDGQLNGLGVTVTGDKWEQGIFSNGNVSTSYDFYTTGNESGCTAGDCQNKYGKFKWSNGDSFIGFFKNGQLHMGTYTFASGDKYSGMFNSDNQFHGTGRFFFSDGAYYGGNWVNGKYDGRGYYHDKDLVQQIGVWSNGTLVDRMR
ncbi:MAG: hypothetical protein HKN48_01095 [Flavobacteriaceae bacterium]|nr:hypothetical protein [Flavobacteriaceae bacterium]